jgi:DNA-binding NtrC family response regulator
VLILDDDAVTRVSLAAAIEDCDLEPIEAADVRECLAALESRPAIRVLVSDIRLPDGDGRALIEEVAVRWPSVRLVLISGDAPAGRAVSPERATFLHKPLSPDAVCLVVRRLLKEADAALA